MSRRERLRRAARVLRAERVDLQGLADAQGPAALHTLWVLLGALSMTPVPGVGTVLGLGVIGLAAALWRGGGEPMLPAPVARFELSHPTARRVLMLLAHLQGLAERVARPRCPLAARLLGPRTTAMLLALAGATIALPIPFGNLLPALALICIGIAQPRHDGLLAMLGALLVLAGLAWPLGLAAGAWQAGAAWLAA